MTQATLALARYAWTRRRKTSLVIIGLAGVGEAIALLSLLAPDNDVWQDASMAMFAIFFAPCLLYSVAMFDFTKSSDLTSSRGGYDDWLLRQPIETWKLALVPALFLTLPLAAAWGVVAITLRFVAGVNLPIFQQSLAMGAVAIFASAVVWRPQRQRWQRTVLLIGSIPFLYPLAVGSVAIALEAPQWTGVMSLIAVGSYISANLFAWRSVSLARVSAYQQIAITAAATGRRSISGLRPATEAKGLLSPSAALRWHDLASTWETRWLGAICFMAPMILLAAVLPLTVATVIFALAMAGITSAFVAASLIETPIWSRSSSLPSYLIVSPIRSRTIAWSRLLTIGLASMRLYVLASAFCLFALAWPANREVAGQWWAAQLQGPSVAEPQRIAIAIWIGTLVASVGFAMRTSSLALYGQQKPLALVTFSSIAIAFGLSGWFLVWFLGQTDWEVVELTMRSWLERVPSLACVVLGLKLCTAIVGGCIAYQRELIPTAQIVRICLGWLAVVLVTATCLWTLWPSPSVSFPLVLLASAIAVPLSPLLYAPIAVDANRHRGNMKRIAKSEVS